jgi:hypothetical protein
MAERRVAPGDHVCVSFDEPREAGAVAADVLKAGQEDGAVSIAFVPSEIRTAITHALGDHPALDEVIWRNPADAYGRAFDPDGFVARFKAMAKTETRPVYVIGGAHEPVQSFTTPDEWARYEQLATETAVECGMVVLCLYDTRLHAPEYLHNEDAHPLHAHDGVIRRNEAYSYAPAA